MIEIKGNDVKFKDSLKINFLGVAILKQDFVFKISRNNESSFYITDHYPSYARDSSVSTVLAKDLDEKHSYYKGLETKPIYHCYLLLDIGSILKSPIIFWSMSYKTEKSVTEMIELCSNSAKALIKKRSTKKTTVMANVISDFKLKYGKDEIPIRMITPEFAIKKELPGLNHISHSNKKVFI